MSSQEESHMLTASSEEFTQSRSSISSTPDVTQTSPLSSLPEEEAPAHVVISMDPESFPAHVVSFSPRLAAAILSLGARVSEQEEEEEKAKTSTLPSSPSSLSIGRRFSQIAGMLPDRRFSMVSALSVASQGRKICRFCWDGSGDLVASGCLCHDSLLHPECLVRWIESNKRKEKIACEICLGKHHVEFSPELQQRMEAALKAAEAMGVADSVIRQHHVLRHPRLAKVVLVLSICLIVMAVLLVIAYVVIFSMSLTTTTTP